MLMTDLKESSPELDCGDLFAASDPPDE